MASPVVMTTKPLWLQGVTGYSALDMRAVTQAAFFEGVDNINNDFKVIQKTTGTNMSVDVNGGRAVIQGNAPAGSRYYMVADDTEIAANVLLDAAPGSNSRVDLIVAKVRDAAVGGGANSDWTIEPVTGTVAASPSPPAVPDNSIELARVTVASGTSAITNAMITDRRTCMHRVGRSFGALPAQPIAGQLISDSGTGRVYRGNETGSGYVDINALGMELTTRSGGSLFGGTPPANTVYKWETATKGVGFLSGDANIALESTFTGILFFSATAIGNSKVIPISRRTNHDAVLNGSQIPVYALECNVFGNAVVNGTITVTYLVVGW
jgi:hypothetical protein